MYMYTWNFLSSLYSCFVNKCVKCKLFYSRRHRIKYTDNRKNIKYYMTFALSA